MEEDDYPPEVKWIKLGAAKSRARKLPEDMITQEEVLRLINAAKVSRDRAFVSTLYESGCRLGELLPLKIGQLQFDSLGAQLRVNGKKRDDLQQTIALLKDGDFGLPLQFTNFRD